MSQDDERVAKLAEMNRMFSENVPHNRTLGMSCVELADGRATYVLPYADKLIGNPITRVLHGGAITALMDAASGAAAFMKLERPTSLATLDLRIDYLKPAEPGRDVTCLAECYKRTRNVAFVRSVAYHENVNDPIASSTGTFMLGTTRRRKPEVNS